jgi:hypothetical protein
MKIRNCLCLIALPFFFATAFAEDVARYDSGMPEVEAGNSPGFAPVTSDELSALLKKLKNDPRLSHPYSASRSTYQSKCMPDKLGNRIASAEECDKIFQQMRNETSNSNINPGSNGTDQLTPAEISAVINGLEREKRFSASRFSDVEYQSKCTPNKVGKTTGSAEECKQLLSAMLKEKHTNQIKKPAAPSTASCSPGLPNTMVCDGELYVKHSESINVQALKKITNSIPSDAQDMEPAQGASRGSGQN